MSIDTNAGIGPDKAATVADQLSAMAMSLACKASIIAVQANEKLQPIIAPTPEVPIKDEVRESWPPLFSVLREHLTEIDRALNFIDKSIRDSAI